MRNAFTIEHRFTPAKSLEKPRGIYGRRNSTRLRAWGHALSLRDFCESKNNSNFEVSKGRGAIGTKCRPEGHRGGSSLVAKTGFARLRNKSRNGFSFVTAIMMMLLISVVGMAMLQLSNMSVEQKGQAFMKTQAELLARSATEYAIKDMLFNPNSMPPADDLDNGKTIEINAGLYHITMEIQFLGAPTALAINPDDRKYYGTMLIDTIVETTIDGMPIRYVRRTVQRP